MSGYGPPQGPSGGASAFAPSSAPANPEQRAQLLMYVAGGLGVLSFIWGFLDWLSADGIDDVGVSGYGSVGAAVIGLSVAAGLTAVAGVLEKKPVGLTPAAVAVAALLVVLGQLFSHGDGVSVSIGLILALITVILQAAALIVAWLLVTGKMALPAPKPAQNQWQQPPQGQYGPPQQSGPQQQGPQQSGQQQGYGPPPQNPSQGYGPPPGYQPTQQSDYGRPSEYGQQQPGQQQPGQRGPGQPGQQQPGQQQPGQQQPGQQQPGQQQPGQQQPGQQQPGQQQP